MQPAREAGDDVRVAEIEQARKARVADDEQWAPFAQLWPNRVDRLPHVPPPGGRDYDPYKR